MKIKEKFVAKMKVLAKLSCIGCAENEIVSQGKWSSGRSSKQEPPDF